MIPKTHSSVRALPDGYMPKRGAAAPDGSGRWPATSAQRKVLQRSANAKRRRRDSETEED